MTTKSLQTVNSICLLLIIIFFFYFFPYFKRCAMCDVLNTQYNTNNMSYFVYDRYFLWLLIFGVCLRLHISIACHWWMWLLHSSMCYKWISPISHIWLCSAYTTSHWIGLSKGYECVVWELFVLCVQKDENKKSRTKIGKK